MEKKSYLCKMIMRKEYLILTLTLILLLVSCDKIMKVGGDMPMDDVVATVDGVHLLRADLNRDMPSGLSGADSVTFTRMYVDDWVLKQLKMRRASEVLSSREQDIERLVEGYRQSLLMRKLDQHYVDSVIDLEITPQQIAAHYRARASHFKLSHHLVRGVVVKAPRTFRNTQTLATALKSAKRNGTAEEVIALGEKHGLQVTDMTQTWVSYSDFLSNLPTVRTRSYEDLLDKSGVQQMSSDDALFRFIILDVARKGETAPMECVEQDIRRMLYAERRSAIVNGYEEELKRAALAAGRITIADTIHMQTMGYLLEEPKSVDISVREPQDSLFEEEIINE